MAKGFWGGVVSDLLSPVTVLTDELADQARFLAGSTITRSSRTPARAMAMLAKNSIDRDLLYAQQVITERLPSLTAAQRAEKSIELLDGMAPCSQYLYSRNAAERQIAQRTVLGMTALALQVAPRDEAGALDPLFKGRVQQIFVSVQQSQPNAQLAHHSQLLKTYLEPLLPQKPLASPAAINN